MVTITNGIRTFRVTSGAVKIYESMGFHIETDEDVSQDQEYVEDDEKESIMNSENPVSDRINTEGIKVNSKEELFIEELLEKPLSQWSNEEVKEFVKIKEIDTSGAQKVSQVRGIIKAYLEEQNKNA